MKNIFKECSRCLRDKKLNAFASHNKTKDGLFPICRQCQKEASDKYYQQNKEKIKERSKFTRLKEKMALQGKYWCSKCQEFYPEESFSVSDRGSVSRYCRDCANAYAQKHYQSNKKKYFEKRDRWREENPEKHRAQSGRRYRQQTVDSLLSKIEKELEN